MINVSLQSNLNTKLQNIKKKQSKKFPYIKIFREEIKQTNKLINKIVFINCKYKIPKLLYKNVHIIHLKN